MAAANGLIDAAEATHNPVCCSRYALLAYGLAFRDADPAGALDALRRGLVIAQDSGNRYNESLLADSSGPPRGRTRRPAGRARSPHSGDPQLPRLGQHHLIRVPPGGPRRPFRPARTLRTGGHHRRFRAQPPHRSGHPRDQHRDRPPTRCPRRPDLRIARPQG